MSSIQQCMTCGKKHGGQFYRCTSCGYTSCQQKDGGIGKKCPSCNKGNTRKQAK